MKLKRGSKIYSTFMSWIGRFLFLISIILISTGCMMMGGNLGDSTIQPLESKSSEKSETSDTELLIDQMILDAVTDLSNQDLSINSVAVWGIRTQSIGLNVELIKQKLITRLVNLSQFNVVSRDRLKELLEEQSLSLTGTIDEKSAVEVGNLIGVGAFVDGYISKENNQIVLSLKLIETKNGVIIWARTFNRLIKS